MGAPPDAMKLDSDPWGALPRDLVRSVLRCSSIDVRLAFGVRPKRLPRDEERPLPRSVLKQPVLRFFCSLKKFNNYDYFLVPWLRKYTEVEPELKGTLLCISHSFLGNFEFECDEGMSLLGYNSDGTSLWKIDNSMFQHSVTVNTVGDFNESFSRRGKFDTDEATVFSLNSTPEIIVE
jgi:hypothetical protein